MHERAGLDQLQRGDGAQHGVDLRAIRVAARAPPAPPGEGRPDALAAAQHELAQVARGGAEGGVDGGGGRAAPVEEVRQRLLEADGQVEVGGVQAGLRRPSGGGAHGRGPAPGRGSAPGGREDTAPSVTAPLGHGAATRRRHRARCSPSATAGSLTVGVPVGRAEGLRLSGSTILSRVKVTDRLDPHRPVFSVEFFPPKDEAGEAELWRAIRRLEPLDPAFVSVTYGAGGSSRDRTIRTTARIATDTTLVPMAHLTAVSHSVAELRHVIGAYAAAGIRNILAVRGDPPAARWASGWPTEQGLTYADELVRLVRGLGDFCVGVAAFPYGHPRSADTEADTARLLAKIRAGADFAITQLFLEPEGFLRLRDRLAALGCDVPLLPGIMPVLSVRTLRRGPELSGAPVPPAVWSGWSPSPTTPWRSGRRGWTSRRSCASGCWPRACGGCTSTR